MFPPSLITRLYPPSTPSGTTSAAPNKLPTEAPEQKAAELIVQPSPQLHSDNRKRASSEVVLRQRVLDLIRHNKTVSACSIPGSIEPRTCSSYGPLNKVQTQCTGYARQAAELLINESGKLDRSRIAEMVDQLKSDETLPAEHKSHVARTLTALQQDHELAETIDSICEEKPLTGGAADVVRGTLNLPPDHSLTKADARKAVVTSLLGYLRQGKVGSCYATAPAICLLDSSPKVVAKDMKELLEENKLIFRKDNVIFEVPLNKHVQDIYAQAVVKVKEDGTTVTEQVTAGENGAAVTVLKEEAKLQDIFGMQAALTALGILEERQQTEIAEALNRLRHTGIDLLRNGVRFQQIIRCVADANLAKKEMNALRAFSKNHHVVTVKEDGTKEDGTKLQDIPGIQAALAMLGIPVERWQDYIARLLKTLPGNEYKQVGEYKEVDLRKLINYLAIVISSINKRKVTGPSLPGMDDVVRVGPNGAREDGFKLQDIPAIRDVLETLAIPEVHCQAVIANTLQRMLQNGIHPIKNGVSVQQIIDHLLMANKDHMTRLALDAFNARHNKVKVNEDGAREDGIRLQDTPAMQAALTALDIPEEQQQTAISNALKILQDNNKLDNGVMLQQIIHYLAYDAQSVAEVSKKEKSALRAFNGKQDVGLLRTWEYTLAGVSQLSYSDNYNNSSLWSPGQVSAAIFSLESRDPSLQSLANKCETILEELECDPHFDFEEDYETLAIVRDTLFSSMEEEFKKRFIYQMDMNIRHAATTDGVSTHGGFILYEKDPADDPSQWKRIDNANAFMEAMERFVQEAFNNARAHIDASPDDPEIEALQRIADYAAGCIRDPDGRREFLEHAVLLMNPKETRDTFSLDRIENYKLTPWKKAHGSSSHEIVSQYSGEIVTSGPANNPDGVMSFVNLFCDGLARMAPQLQAKAEKSPAGFKIAIVVPGHVLTLMPMEMKEIWSGDPAMRMTPQEWIFTNLQLPAEKWRDEPRTLPVLSDLLKPAGAAIGASEEKIQNMYREMHEKIKNSGQSDAEELSYTLKDIHDKLDEYCRAQEDGDALLDKARQVLTNMLPIPAKVIADTNWMTMEGRPLCMGILYNPFMDRMEANAMYQDGSNRKPHPSITRWTDPKAFSQIADYQMFTPMADRDRTKPQESNRKRKFADL